MALLDEEVVVVENHIQGIGHLVNQRDVLEVRETSWHVRSWMECEDVQAIGGFRLGQDDDTF